MRIQGSAKLTPMSESDKYKLINGGKQAVKNQQPDKNTNSQNSQGVQSRGN